MKVILALSVCVLCSLKCCNSAGLPQGRQGIIQQANRQGNIHAGNRQGVGGLSFAIPGLSLLAGNNGGGNLFGLATVTRTLVSTVSTVTTASFRTCVMPTANLMPCAAGRRRRDAEDIDGVSAIVGVDSFKIEPTAAMQIIVGPTTIKDPEAVAEYLEAHKPCTQSVIYPPNVHPIEIESSTTPLYPSQDTPDTTDGESDGLYEGQNDNTETLTSTETPGLHFDEISEDENSGTTSVPINDEGDDIDRARVGLGRTTTVTTIIRVTSVATSLATGAMATLQISYAGCLPPSLPISGPPCVA